MKHPLSYSVYQYSSSAEFLQDAYESIHRQDESFSFEKIADLAGLKSRTEARNIIKGQKKPAEAALHSMARVFGLGPDETEYLVLLSRFEQSTGTEPATELFQKLITLQKSKHPSANPFREIEVATSALHMSLLSVADLEEAPSEPERISELLKGRYSPSEVAAAIVDLEQQGFTSRDPVTGRMKVLQKHVKKYDFNANIFLKSFHEQCLEIAQNSLESEGPKERYLVGASFCINSKVFPRIIQKMNAFLENLMQLEGVAGSPDTVVQINQQLIKMTVSGHAQAESGLGAKDTERVFRETSNPVIAQDAIPVSSDFLHVQ